MSPLPRSPQLVPHHHHAWAAFGFVRCLVFEQAADELVAASRRKWEREHKGTVIDDVSAVVMMFSPDCRREQRHVEDILNLADHLVPDGGAAGVTSATPAATAAAAAAAALSGQGGCTRRR